MSKRETERKAKLWQDLDDGKALLKQARDYIVTIGEHMWCTGSNTACIVCKITAFLGDVCPTRTMNSPDLVWPEDKQ